MSLDAELEKCIQKVLDLSILKRKQILLETDLYLPFAGTWMDFQSRNADRPQTLMSNHGAVGH